jgi:methylated-DNA-protein-cysteine methyltransferase-like protein
VVISFHQRVVAVIKKIPKGKVATYGQVAVLAGSPRAAYQVVRILHTSSKKEQLPWHRVVNQQGKVSLKPGSGYEIQKALLTKEGVTFDNSDTIDFKRFLWSPSLNR